MCIIVMLLPIICFNFSNKKSTVENRYLADFPKLFIDNKINYKYILHFNNWLNDNIGFREMFVHYYSNLMYYIFDTTSNKNIIKGKSGWLYYDRKTDGECIENYKGFSLYDDDTLKKILNNLIETRDYLKKTLGAEFILYIAPNKDRIYEEYLPDYIGTKAEVYKTKQLYNYLKENSDIIIVYPYQELIDSKSIIYDNLYYKTDSHWNFVGSYIGAKELLKTIGITLPTIDGNIVKSVKKESRIGDLVGPIGMEQELNDIDCEYYVEGFNDNNVKSCNHEGLIEYQSEAGNNIDMYIIKDSFGSYMSKYLGSQVHHLWERYTDSFKILD